MSRAAAAWLDDSALCVQIGGDLWFPEKPGQSGAAAKKICRACPVRTECLEQAMANVELFGIFGGLSVKERQKLRAEREAA